jgi:hypothetical protein
LITRCRGARAAALTIPAAIALALVLVLAPAPPLAAQPTTWTLRDSATFEIYQDDRLLGVETFRTFRTNDTLVVGSALRLPGRAEGSSLPRLKNTTFLRRYDSSFPIVFQVSEVGEDSTVFRAINCVFNDTTVVVYKEDSGVGQGTTLALPPGRLYLLEPGIYAQVQTLAGDFVQSSQDKRKQPVLIPSAGVVVDLFLTRGPREQLGQGSHIVETTRIAISDKLTELVAWVDDAGRMWKMEAPGQGLRVERPMPAPAAGSKKAKGATKR